MRVPVSVALARARDAVRDATVWDGDRLATLEWWTDPGVLTRLGPGLRALFPEAVPTWVVGVQSSGYLLAPLVALELGVGMLGVQKLPEPDGTIRLATAPDAVAPGDSVLLVDDVVESGAQAAAVRDMLVGAGASWLGVATMVTYRERPDLGVRALFDIEQLRSVTLY